MTRGWCVGVLRGPSLDRLQPMPEPVLDSTAVTDLDACFVADPFVVRGGDDHWMFFEAMVRNGVGAIGAAHSGDGLRWQHRGIVFNPPRHLSYPCVVRWRDRIIMTHEDLGMGGVPILCARELPWKWDRIATLEETIADPTLLVHDGLLWLFGCGRPYQHDQLRLWFAETPEGPWREHPCSPLIDGDERRGRPAGRIVELDDGRLFRPSQDCVDSYGHAVYGNIIECLTPTNFRERPGPRILQAGPEAWRSARMHHLDAWRMPDGSWRAVADGSDV